ncbi:MAG: hypothetical protein KZQ98_14050 [Candidatus Thiodiazotropha sp. (ex Lucinoma borealis)]|nr:hypothetical protein [Candidatus Thiodiazotropha sp. (ex Lucinoma borealis)]
MSDTFRHLHMPADLACEFLAVFSRMEYALKATRYASGNEGRVTASWDRFANDIDEAFGQVTDDKFMVAVNYLLTRPPRKQVRQDGSLTFEDQVIDNNQRRAQQTILMVRTVRNNLFHGGKHLPDGEIEQGRNQELVQHSLTVLKQCVLLNEIVSQCYEQ